MHSGVAPDGVSRVNEGQRAAHDMRNDDRSLIDLGSHQMKKQGKAKASHIGAPACFLLELECRHICDAFDSYGCYVVGSAMERADWRDVDVRLIMDDAEFAKLFPGAGDHWEHDARWLLLTASISEHLSQRIGLPIDFQFQPQTHANERHKGTRNAIGLRIKREQGRS